MENGKLALNPQPEILYLVNRKILSAFESYADWENIKLSFENETNKDLKIELDSEKYETVLNNLLSNAFKFTNPGGQITVKVENLAEKIRVEVEDTGRGISPEDLPHIFERYFQTSKTNAPAEGGTGIGLALSHQIAQLFKGDLLVESELSKGSRFIFEFPVKEVLVKLNEEEVGQLAVPSSQLAVTNQPITSNGLPISYNSQLKTILLVEDNHDLRSYIKSILEKKYQVIEAANGKVAWEMLNHGAPLTPKGGPPRTASSSTSDLAGGGSPSGVRGSVGKIPQLIISDLMMPQMDGYQLLKKLKSDDRFRGIPTIILTAKASSDEKLKALRIGVDDYLTKPFDEEELKVRVENLLRNYESRQFAPLIPKGREAFVGDKKGRIGQPTPNQESEIKNQVSADDLEWLENLEKIIVEQIENPNFKIENLAQELFISRSKLYRQIKQLTGLTANQYLIEIRLTTAKKLLENNTLPMVKAVALAVGFKDIPYFSKLFKARFGKLPSEYFQT